MQIDVDEIKKFNVAPGDYIVARISSRNKAPGTFKKQMDAVCQGLRAHLPSYVKILVLSDEVDLQKLTFNDIQSLPTAPSNPQDSWDRAMKGL